MKHLLCKACILSRIWVFATPWTVAPQAHLSMGFSRQEYWSGLPVPPSGDLPDPGIKPMSPTLAGVFFTTEPPGKPIWATGHFIFSVNKSPPPCTDLMSCPMYRSDVLQNILNTSVDFFDFALVNRLGTLRFVTFSAMSKRLPFRCVFTFSTS